MDYGISAIAKFRHIVCLKYVFKLEVITNSRQVLVEGGRLSIGKTYG
jgi:hypothetical protein